MEIGIGDCDVCAKHRLLPDFNQLSGADRAPGNSDTISNLDPCPGSQGSKDHRMVHAKSSGEARRDYRHVPAKTNGTSREHLDDWSSNRINMSLPVDAGTDDSQ